MALIKSRDGANYAKHERASLLLLVLVLVDEKGEDHECRSESNSGLQDAKCNAYRGIRFPRHRGMGFSFEWDSFVGSKR